MPRNILELLETTAARLPGKTAFVSEEEVLSFSRLRAMALAVGSRLHSLGVCRQPVALLMERSPRQIAAFLGVAAGGCFYLPLDSELPDARIRLLLDRVRPPLLLCDAACAPRARELAGACRVLLFEEAAAFPVNGPALAEIYENGLDTDPLYIVFTSGSTGVPKAVAASHRSVLDYAEQLTRVLETDEDTVLGCQAPLFLDACLKELLSALRCGASVWLLPRGLFRFPVRLVEELNRRRINTLCWTASALSLVSSLGTFRTVRPLYLRTVAFGGEVFPPEQLALWRQAAPRARFFNLYGPTEGTGMCCYYRVDRDFAPGERIPIGRPFPNTGILLLTEDGREAAPGQAGEICIRGASLALGYYNDPEQTARAFVQNPLDRAVPERIYRTGDLGRLNERGELEFLSRRDGQIKRMGHRVELGEIEAQAAQVPGVRLCGCAYDAARGRLSLFYTGEPGEEVLRTALRELLPRPMLPDRVVRLEALPLGPGGKLDRAALARL